jgi:hypothetical protein
MLRTLEATIDSEGKVHFAESVQLKKSHRVLITLLDDEITQQPTNGTPQVGSLQRILALLSSPEFRERPYGSPEEIEATIQENHKAWDN